MKWYVVQVAVNSEDKMAKEIRMNISNASLTEVEEVLVPKERVFEFTNGELVEKEKTFFPGYIFVKMILTDSVKQMISSMGKIASFLGGPNPTPVSQVEMDKIFQMLKESSEKPSFVFSVGDKVKICDGPFSSFVGVVEEIYREKSTLRVSVFVFGQYTPVELNFSQIEKVKDI